MRSVPPRQTTIERGAEVCKNIRSVKHVVYSTYDIYIVVQYLYRFKERGGKKSVLTGQTKIH